MATASAAVKKVKALEIQLDTSKDYYTVKRAQMIFHGQKFDWKPLKKACIELGIEWTKVFDANYQTVNAYPSSAWKHAYTLNIKGEIQ